MPGPETFEAIDEANALPVLAAFVAYVNGERVLSVSGPVRESRTKNGKALVFEPPSQKFPGSFRVAIAGTRSVKIGEGEVNGRIPFLAGRDLAGLRADGTEHPNGKPFLDLSEEPEGRRSWVCLLVGVNTESVYDELLPGEEGATIVHRVELPVGVPYGLDEEGRGLRPIAQLTWNADRSLIERVRQVLHFDQVYQAPQGEDPRPTWSAAG
jgi:hypothetical protein